MTWAAGGGAEQQGEDDINIKFKYGKSVPGKEGVGTETLHWWQMARQGHIETIIREF